MYDKFQAEQDKSQIRQILDMAWRKVHSRINQWQTIMIIYTAIQNISDKICIDSFVAVNLHPHHCLSVSELIKNIVPAFITVEIAYFRNHKGSYYYSIPSVWGNIIVINSRELFSIIYCLVADTPHVKPLWTKQKYFLLFLLYPLTKSP